MTDRITVLTGPSGVGKSHLLNALDPTLNVEVGELREYLHKGRHTTRAAQLYALPLGEHTFIADTPGIRELGLYEIDPHNLQFYFREFASYLHDCRFPNCTHDHEPGCACARRSRPARSTVDGMIAICDCCRAKSSARRQGKAQDKAWKIR